MSEQASDNNATEDSSNANTKKVRLFVTVLGTLLIIIGQIIIATSPIREEIGSAASFSGDSANLWVNIAILLLIVGIFLFVWSIGYKPPESLKAFFSRFQLSGVTPWIIASFILSLLSVLAMLLFENARVTNYIPVVTMWFFAGICYAAGFIRNQFSGSKFREWFKLHHYELLGIGLLTLLGIFLRFYRLGDLPRVVNGDEGRVGIAALSTNTYPYVNPYALWENFGALYLQGINLFLNFFGVNPFSLRLIAAIGGSIAIPAVYLLARQVSGHRIAMIAASLLLMSHTQIHFSRTVAVAYIQGTWLIPLELYFLLSGIMKKSSWRAALGGMILAIHFSVYLDAQIMTALILVYLLIAFVFLRSWLKPALQQVAVFWTGFAVMILPEFAYVWEHPAEFFNRLSKDGMFQTGWLAQEMANTHSTIFEILAQRIVHTFLSLIYYPSFDFYGTSSPVLSLLTAILFLLGLGIMLRKTRLPGFLLLNGYFWSGILSVAIFSLPASADTYRVLIVLPVALIMAAVGLDSLLDALGLGWTQARATYMSAVLIILVSIFAVNYWTYYVDFVTRCKYGTDDGPTRFASYLGNTARGIDRFTDIYLLSDPIYFQGSHQSVDFLSNKRKINNIADPVDTLQVRPGEVIIASPNRLDELKTWAENHPGGVIDSQYDCQNLILLAYQFP